MRDDDARQELREAEPAAARESGPEPSNAARRCAAIPGDDPYRAIDILQGALR